MYCMLVILESDLIFQIMLYLILTCHIVYRFFFAKPPNLFSKDTKIQIMTTLYEEVRASGSTLQSDENCENYSLAVRKKEYREKGSLDK